jgi:penicillin-binding protein 1A
MTKKPIKKKGSVKKPVHRKGAHSVYRNINKKRKVKVDSRSRKKAEFLATLPKTRIKRLAYRLNPKRFFKYWFSKDGALMALKLVGVGMALFIVLLLGIFAIFRNDLALGPDELAKRVQSRTTKFYDRTGQVLLYDLYKDQQLTFVKSDQISDNMKFAMVAIEDREFYKHNGFDAKGIIRSLVNNASGGDKQGASTITQQLARVVILEDNTATGLAGYTRKIKELILSIELERTYSKDEILNFYLNSVSFGGTAIGVESAAQRYFNKPASKLSISESAYIASIPQFPTIYDRNNANFNAERTIARQQTVITNMQEQGYISEEEESKAKKIDILAKIKPLKEQQNIKAPHYINEIITELEGRYGPENVRQGGWRITTTLDWDMQQLAEKSIADNIANVEALNGDNAAVVAIDVKTNQVLAMAGSRKYNHPGFGQTNAATAPLQPGSSLKPFVYGELFDQGSYGPGSIIPDTPQSFYGINPSNFDKGYRGNIPIRSSLAESRNLPAMKAAQFVGMDKVIDTAKKAGETDITCGFENECTNPFLAIGSGDVRLDQHTAAYASMARGYVAKPQASILKIEKSNGEIVEEWKDTEGDLLYGDKNRGEQIRFLLADILSDDVARSPTFGSNQRWFNPPNVKIAVKTGTTDNQKDGWMMGFSPNLAVGVWTGNHDGTPMHTHTDLSTGPIFASFVPEAHTKIMSKAQYGWKANDWFPQPQGIQWLKVGGKNDKFQSWFKKPKESKKKYTMDKVSKKLATSCTPSGAKETIEVLVISDPTRPGSEVVGSPPDGYDIKNKDDAHKCGDKKPSVGSVSLTEIDALTRTYTLQASVSKGKFGLKTVDFIVNGKVVSSQKGSGSSYSTTYKFPKDASYTVRIKVTDSGYYTGEGSSTYIIPQP